MLKIFDDYSFKFITLGDNKYRSDKKKQKHPHMAVLQRMMKCH